MVATLRPCGAARWREYGGYYDATRQEDARTRHSHTAVSSVRSSSVRDARMAETSSARHKRPRKRPLVTLLVERGLFDSEGEAQRWVMAGQVLVAGQRSDKPGALVACDALLQVRGRRHYVSRGGYKLAAVLDHFAVVVADRVALDSGASTGGFTDCLVKRGAALVYAVDVGFGQLAGSLCVNPCVRTLERTNLGDGTLTTLVPRPTLITLDISYLSLTAALPLAASLLAARGEVLALFKPLFEVDDPDARRTGRVDNPKVLVDALRRVLEAGQRVGLVPQGLTKLALRPRHGVLEFFLYFTNDPRATPLFYDNAVLAAIVTGAGIGSAEEGL